MSYYKIGQRVIVKDKSERATYKGADLDGLEGKIIGMYRSDRYRVSIVGRCNPSSCTGDYWMYKSDFKAIKEDYNNKEEKEMNSRRGVRGYVSSEGRDVVEVEFPDGKRELYLKTKSMNIFTGSNVVVHTEKHELKLAKVLEFPISFFDIEEYKKVHEDRFIVQVVDLGIVHKEMEKIDIEVRRRELEKELKKEADLLVEAKFYRELAENDPKFKELLDRYLKLTKGEK